MRPIQFHDDPKLNELVNKFEDASEKGTPAFFEPQELSELIDYYESEFLPERALEVCQYGTAQYPFTSTFHLRQAMILLDSGQNEGIMDLLDQAETLSPVAIEPKLLRANALACAGKFVEASQLLRTLRNQVTSVSDLSQVYFQQALIFEKQGDYNRMFDTLKIALLKDPTNAEALDRMWVCVELSKRHEDSIDFHEHLLEHDSYSSKAWYNLGHAFSYQGRYVEAADAFEYSFLVDENFEFAYRDCGEICFEVRNFERALKCYSEVLERFEPDTDLYIRIGQCLLSLNFPEKANRYFQLAIQMDSLSDEAYFHLGECLMEAGKYIEASNNFKQAIRIDDRREEYYSGLAEAYYQLDQLDKAELHFQTAIDIAPESAEHWVRLATFLMDIDRSSEGIDLIEQAQDHAVGAELIYCQVALLLDQGHRAEGLFLLEEALVEDYELHQDLFDLLPDLESDPEIRAIIETFRPLDA